MDIAMSGLSPPELISSWRQCPDRHSARNRRERNSPFVRAQRRLQGARQDFRYALVAVHLLQQEAFRSRYRGDNDPLRGELSVGEVAARFAISTACHHAALAGAGGGWIDRAPDRAPVALRTRACERVGTDGKLARTAAAAWSAALDRMEAVAAAQTPKQRKS